MQWIMLPIPALSFLIGVGFAIYRVDFLSDATPTTATIVELVESENSEGVTIFYPEFTFTDASGTPHRVRSSGGSSHPSVSVGDEIAVLYDPEEPENAVADSFLGLWGLSAILILLGIVPTLFILGWGYVHKLIHRQSSSARETAGAELGQDTKRS